MPENLRYGGGVEATILNPVVAVVLLLAGLLIFFLPQKKAIIPFLVFSVVIPLDQVIVIAGLHFPVLRILLLFAMVRILLIRGQGSREFFAGGMNRIDMAVIALSIVTAVAGVLLFQDDGAVIFQLGQLYSVFCTYVVFRCLVRDRDDVYRVIRVFAWIAFALALEMAYERIGGTNLYAKLGGARAGYYATLWVRDGKIRATGPFGVSILAGTFGAVLVPLFLGLWLTERKQRAVALLGAISATVMTVACNSSTPVAGYLAGLVGLALWPFRRATRLIRWAIVIVLVSLHMVMKAPVWSLIARIDITGGSSGDHRYQLINQTILHFWDWWLIGTASNASWGWDMWDTANQYVSSAVSSGLPGLILFIAVIVYGFKYVGRARRNAPDKKEALFFWALGSALLAHTVSFVGISYWDQTILAWYALLAMISAVAVPSKAPAAAPRFAPDLEFAPESHIVARAGRLSSPWLQDR